MNSRWGDVGGLHGFFQRFDLPNYMAKGGIIPDQSYAGGGVVGEVNSLASAAGSTRSPSLGTGNAWQESGGKPNTPARAVAADLDSGRGPAAGWCSRGPGCCRRLGLASVERGEHPRRCRRDLRAGFEKADIRPWPTGPATRRRRMRASSAPRSPVAARTCGHQGPGLGDEHTLVQQSADKMITAANAYHAHQPVATAGASARRASRERPGLGSFDGLRGPANWIIPILNLAQGHGWSGRITSGVPTRRRHEHRAAVQSLTDELSRWRGSTSVISTRALSASALWDVVKNYPGSPCCTRTDRAPGSVQGLAPRLRALLRDRARGRRFRAGARGRRASAQTPPSQAVVAAGAGHLQAQAASPLRARSSIRC